MGHWYKNKPRYSLCPSCNVFNDYDAQKTHHGNCGTLLIHECPQCKKDIHEKVTHCPSCGTEYRPKV